MKNIYYKVSRIWQKLSRYRMGLAYNGIGSAIALLTQVILARLMGSSNYGLLALTISLVLLPSSMADLGVSASIPRFLSVSIGEKRIGRVRPVMRKGGMVMAVSATFFTMFMFAMAPIIASWMNIPSLAQTLPALAVFIPFIYAKNYISGILKGTGRNVTEIALSQVLFCIVTLGLGVGMWLMTGAMIMVVVGHGLAYMITVLAGAFFAWRAACDFRKQSDLERFTFKELIGHGLPLNITALAQRIFQRADVIVIGAMLGEQAVGLYRVAFSASSGIKRLITPLNNFAGYWLGIYAGGERDADFRRYYVNMVMASLTLTMPVYFGLFALAGDVIPWVFGKEYAASSSLAQILCIGFIFFTAVGPMGTLFNTIGKNWVRMWIVLTLSLFNIGANVVLINLFGVIGTAFSTSLSFTLLFVIFYYFIKRILSDFRTPLHPLILILTVSGFCVFYLVLPLSTSNLRIFTAIIGIMIVMFFCLAVNLHYLKRNRGMGSQL